MPVSTVLVGRDDLAIAVVEIAAYSEGFVLRLAIRLRDEPDEPSAICTHDHRRHDGAFAPEVLRFGIEFSDGGKATNVSGRPRSIGEEQAGPVLIDRGGGGGGRSWDFGYWVWPLPPEGPLRVVIEWPAMRVPETAVEFDTAPIRAAAAQSAVLWPGDDHPPRGSFGISTMTSDGP